MWDGSEPLNLKFPSTERDFVTKDFVGGMPDAGTNCTMCPKYSAKGKGKVTVWNGCFSGPGNVNDKWYCSGKNSWHTLWVMYHSIQMVPNSMKKRVKLFRRHIRKSKQTKTKTPTMEVQQKGGSNESASAASSPVTPSKHILDKKRTKTKPVQQKGGSNKSASAASSTVTPSKTVTSNVTPLKAEEEHAPSQKRPRTFLNLEKDAAPKRPRLDSAPKSSQEGGVVNVTPSKEKRDLEKHKPEASDDRDNKKKLRLQLKEDRPGLAKSSSTATPSQGGLVKAEDGNQNTKMDRAMFIFQERHDSDVISRAHLQSRCLTKVKAEQTKSDIEYLRQRVSNSNKTSTKSKDAFERLVKRLDGMEICLAAAIRIGINKESMKKETSSILKPTKTGDLTKTLENVQAALKTFLVGSESWFAPRRERHLNDEEWDTFMVKLKDARNKLELVFIERYKSKFQTPLCVFPSTSILQLTLFSFSFPQREHLL